MNTRFPNSRIFLVALAALLTVPALLWNTSASAGGGNAKVDICHIPPGNPVNFHTIRVSEKAMAAHLAHGDVAGACNALCATLCDDGDACTIDDSADCEQNGCPSDRAQVDCNDGNACTADSCDPASGCGNTPRTGEACDDGQVCSGPDTCDATGACVGAPIDGCCLSDDECSQNPCDGASCNPATNACEQDPVVCTPPDACSVSVCDAVSGDCANTPVVCGADETCNPNSGACEAFCPCFDEVSIDAFARTFSCGSCFDTPDYLFVACGFESGIGEANYQICSGEDSAACGSNVGPSYCYAADEPNGISGVLLPTTDAQHNVCERIFRESQLFALNCGG